MKYAFDEIFDIPKLTRLCENFTKINGTVTALLDLEGTVHIKTGWQRICTQYHRQNPVSAARCLESDTYIAGQLAEGSKYNAYQCKNGLVDIAVPVYVGEEHVANFFTGQFLYKPPEKEYFINQANELGVELIPYIDALNDVPIFEEDEIKNILDFLVSLAETIGEMGLARIQLLEIKQGFEKLAAEDALTMLFNRRSFEMHLDSEFMRAQRYHHPLVVCLIDIDHFKSINDTYGHACGDKALISISETLTNNLRQSDIVFRIGGDELCLLFPESDLNDISHTLEKLRDAIASTPVTSCEASISLTCSFGATQLHNEDDSKEALMTRADRALYQAKAEGRNCVYAI